MRITGGEFGGRRLSRPPAGVRPTSDRVRESLFALLGDLADARVLDLFAGTGALGIEALSRGAEAVVFVDASARSLATLRANLGQLGLESRSRVLKGKAEALLRRFAQAAEPARFDLVLLDPPYGEDAATPALEALVASGVLAPGATVVVESAKRHSVRPIAGLTLRDERRYGDTLITRLEWQAPVQEARTPPDE